MVSDNISTLHTQRGCVKCLRLKPSPIFRIPPPSPVEGGGEGDSPSILKLSVVELSAKKKTAESSRRVLMIIRAFSNLYQYLTQL